MPPLVPGRRNYSDNGALGGKCRIQVLAPTARVWAKPTSHILRAAPRLRSRLLLETGQCLIAILADDTLRCGRVRTCSQAATAGPWAWPRETIRSPLRLCVPMSGPQQV